LKDIRSTSFSMITMVFKIEQIIPAYGSILKFGNLEFGMKDGNLNVRTTPTQIGITLVPNINTWYIAAFRVTGANPFSRNILTFDLFSLEDARGNADLSIGNNNSISKQGNDIIQLLGNDIRIGANGTNEGPGRMSVASLRFYDQGFRSNTEVSSVIKKDARNSFARNWFN
jgi:hypothetical protein